MKSSRSHARLFLVAAAVLALLECLMAFPMVSQALGAVPATNSAAIVHSVIASGGGHTTSASYSLDSTLGQALVGAYTGADTRLSAGFWQAGYRAFMPLVLR